MFKLLLGGTNVEYPLGGAPPGPLGPPQGSLDVRRFWKKIANFLKYYMKIVHASKYPKL